MMKKWILGAATAAMVLVLAGCGSSTVASMKGEKKSPRASTTQR